MIVVNLKNKLFLFFLPFVTATISAMPAVAGKILIPTEDSAPIFALNKEARTAFEYLLDEVAQDHLLSKVERDVKLQEFHALAAGLSPEATPLLINLLVAETHARVQNIFANAGIDATEINERLTNYENAVLNVQEMSVEIARQMLFFVTELVIHRHHVYEFGIALGCPEAQLLIHDLSKLTVEQFEGYARYIKGGKKECDKQGFLKAWSFHQYEEHHLERYEKEGYSPVDMSDERLKINMRETVADLLAATKERGDPNKTLIDWLIAALPIKKPHSRLLPFLKEALIDAHALYLKAEQDPNSDSIFKGFPCWNEQVEEVFRNLESSSNI